MTTITLTATITSNIIKGGGGPQIPPSNLTPPLISGSAVVGQTLSVSNGTWAGSPAPTFSYQWKRNGSDIGGAIGNTYILDQADATNVITCEVTATNIAGWASALSSNSLTVLDADASAFITAASITNATQITAINVLTNDLKGYNIWSKMKAIYPFVGGTASSHKFNLKDPRDLDAAFRLVFNGGWTHSSTGALPNGTNAYANTFFIPLNQFSTDSSAHLSYYSRTNNSNIIVVDFGASNATTSTALNTAYSNQAVSNLHKTSQILISNTNTLGYYIGSRINSTTHKLFKNNSQLGSTETSASGNRANINIYIGSLNDNGTAVLFSPRQVAFATIGDGLTDTDATNLSWITEQYQTTLGRSVNPWYNNGNLLLDNYPSAAVAYSVRKLRNYYIGAAIRVRRSSDNAEQDIFFDSTGNLDTASLLSFVGAGNGFVTTWYDQSGNGRNQTMTTAAQQPQIVSSGVLITRGTKAAVSFDGSNDYLLNNTTGFDIGNITHYAVSSRANSSASYRAVYSTGILSGQGIGFGFFYSSSPQDVLSQQVRNLNLTGAGTGSYVNTLNTNNLIFAFNTTTTDTTYFNGGNVATNPYAKSGILSNSAITIGTRFDSPPISNPGFYHNGTVSELVFWQSNQSANRTAIESNINSYYSVWASGPIWDGSQSGMLNTYSGAAVAYSVRALNSAYTGPLIRVRRSSDNAEIDIFALYNGELDTTFLLNFVGAGSGFVTTWYDQSGNGRNVVQNTATYQPRIVNAGVLETKNNKPMLYRSTNVCYMDSSTFTTINQPTSLFTVNTRNTNNADFMFLFDGGTNRNALYFRGGVQPNQYSIFAGTVADITGTITLNQQYLTFNTFNSTSSIFYRNNIQQGTTYNPNTGGINKISLFAAADNLTRNQSENYSLQEIIFYPTNQTTNLSGINTNINSYFNIY